MMLENVNSMKSSISLMLISLKLITKGITFASNVILQLQTKHALSVLHESKTKSGHHSSLQTIWLHRTH